MTKAAGIWWSGRSAAPWDFASVNSWAKNKLMSVKSTLFWAGMSKSGAGGIAPIPSPNGEQVYTGWPEKKQNS